MEAGPQPAISQALQSSQVESRFKREVREIRESEGYANDGEAFVHLCMKLVFDLDDNEAGGTCAVGRSGHDYGIDAYYLSEDVLYIVQGKFRETVGRELTEDLQTSLRLLRGELRPRGRLKRDLKSLIQLYQEHTGQGKRVVLMPVIFGDLSRQGEECLDAFRNTLPPSHEVDIKKKQNLLESYVRTFGIYSGRGADADIRVNRYYLRQEPMRAVVCDVPASEIARLVGQYGFNMFQLNVREFFGLGNPVNREIANTLTNDDERRYFWYYNLGINAVCDRFELKNNVIHVENLRIVNGCQTANILWENSEHLEGVEINLRITEIQEKQTELADKITISNNRQNPIRGRDLFALDSEQKRLQEEFAALDPPYFYERKTNEWKNLPKNKRGRFREKRTGRGGPTYRGIVNEDAGKAYASMILEKPDIKSRKKDMFKPNSDGGLYEDIFRDRRAEELLFCWRVYREISKRIKGVVKDYKKLESEESGTLPAERRELVEKRIRFITHADTHLTAIVGIVLKRKYGERLPFDRLRQLLDSNPQLYDTLFEWSADTLASYFEFLLSALEADERRRLTFPYRNYLVSPTTFQKVKEHVQGMLRREGNRGILGELPNI
jgi:hypothetical protein